MTIDVAFHAGEGKISIGDREISVQLLSVKRTADGKVDDVTKVGTPVKVNMPAADIDASGGDKAAPKITVRFVPGADAMNISVKDVASGTVKNVLLRVPPGQGTTMGEMRF
ncbi:MAG: hypothetical protein HOP17_17550 [Acidobacteria bacterium]|nr:hypothetical protein [Acidobacteriota bacterium]